ncbi:uncharacterized protein L3040_005397 [Drepanopeziza brunnea f. sp. 'multigermtubi']|uniref:Curved DNA-binding protein n=1 Tax=Marssonina brunnea f. sp. multigermtubi (strain MB_m1) TaxID=1072389 RepID=K1X8Z2_MARBU|nr:Curved DNA-binding protein [Drepanopeziza brunnea f. sp. 'multigermtubi' MB_m1]EKD17178.1 Curved DNA-binding protein [Drepanopeziza brunnea f. sp. 'multigermtubi' MB_m1]KAJ5041831.1 hypothetical protein L3040_005397 [Drepanopeziza brunnea f. sp. 'multigermtubi']
MAPAPVTDDYYLILEVKPTATLEEITKSYKRLALQCHPDRSKESNATAAFQLLGEAYETLKDENKRRAYDSLYHRIKATRPNPAQSRRKSKSTPKPETPTAMPPRQSDEAMDLAEMAATRKNKEQRLAKWKVERKRCDDGISELTRDINKLKTALKEYEAKKKADRAGDAAIASWPTWLLSAFRKKRVESAEEQKRKTYDRLNRYHGANMKLWNLGVKQDRLKDWERQLSRSRAAFDAGNAMDDGAIRFIESRMRDRRAREQQERMLAKQRAHDEALREERRNRDKAQAEAQARARAEWATRAAAARKQAERARSPTQNGEEPSPSKPSAARPRATCSHDGWWLRVDGDGSWDRLACEECSATYSYLLQCPGCKIKACATCQQDLRPVRSWGGGRRPHGERPGHTKATTSPPEQHFSHNYD